MVEGVFVNKIVQSQHHNKVCNVKALELSIDISFSFSTF